MCFCVSTVLQVYDHSIICIVNIFLEIVFDNIYESEIKLTKKISSNDLLRLLLSNSIEILEFKQKTPNMNDIFIMKIEEGNNNV